MTDNSESKSIKIVNSQLGELTINNDAIIHFDNGIIGFENLKNYTIVEIEETEPFIWFVAIDEPEVSFPILKYQYAYPDYEINLQNKNYMDLQLTHSDTFHIFFIITVNEIKEQVTANLKGPLILNLKNNLGIQIISPNEDYVINYPVLTNNNQ